MASMISKKLDEVARNSVWEEHVKKENRVLTLGDSFHIADARKLNVLPEKPNRMVPTSNLSPEMVQKATELLTSMSTLKDSDKLPHEIYALPRTANSEYGFFSSKPLVPPNPMFEHKTKMVDVTEYGNTYVRMAGIGPYVRKDAVSGK
ncbi:hypothetical protein CEUSTIGMA_g13863.t1 [Chlamydomonas eustigma]|uniref:Uncharacterized protein n=1 Tax=Chlamydomonas eustigma TaxID=1157962 RepID=A0A250XTV9_9CHLO|nr:hypothetical protein CEUSTIGMA_g13863.t1 [Chlamydomonas eustigma]|eukprot:GAX86453.1 hypothetical protein CEUSTIGMA_g13863.t1 [Chlamydomonas eustigma]